MGERVDVAWYLGGQIRPTRPLTVTARFGEWSATGRVRTPMSDPQLGAGLSIGGGGYPSALTTETSPRSYKAEHDH